MSKKDVLVRDWIPIRVSQNHYALIEEMAKENEMSHTQMLHIILMHVFEETIKDGTK